MPTFGVTIVIMQEDRVLLTKREDLPVWCLPGGGIEAGESIAQAGIREVFEETGLEIELMYLVGSYSRPRWRNGGGNHDLVFAAKPVKGELLTRTSETLDARYFHHQELPQMMLWWQRQPIRDAVSGVKGVSWSIDAEWPLGGLTRAEARDQFSQDAEKVKTLMEHFCLYPQPGKEKLESGDNQLIAGNP